MVIMMVAPGRSIHSNNWASAMCDRGHKVHFVTQESFVESKYSFNEGIDQRFIVHQLPFRGKKGFILNAFAIRQLTKQINPDVIHVQQAAGYGLLGTFTDQKKAFVSVYGWEVYDLVKSPVWKAAVGYVLHWYRHIGSTGVCMKEQILRVFPDIKTPIVVTPFGIDLKKFKKNPVQKAEFIVGTVKKMDQKYGIEYLIRAFDLAFEKLEAEHPEIAENTYLELVGPGNQVKELKEIANQTKAKDRIRFIGKVPHNEVVNWLNRFDIYVAPSILDSESFGVAVVEASSCERPVIVSNVGGLPEVVRDNVTGFIVPAKDVQSLSEKIYRLMCDPQKRAEMGKNGRRLVSDMYDWEKCVDLMEHVYEAIVRGDYSIRAKNMGIGK